MSEPKDPRPTDAELQLLKILWERGPSTVREVHEALNQPKPTMYTTVLKTLQIMAEKGLVRRDENQRAHVYEAAIERESTQRKLVFDLLDRVFDGSARQLVLHALSSRRASSTELAEIRKFLDDVEANQKGKSS
ncbi:MAG TPA: BlaI/MecI/CopY family transcriptional regulator [Acidobacteriota bacterium]|nr:BlaI/MecI/CopY family transcriptional regulator [Acidobacteriota bacterium]